MDKTKQVSGCEEITKQTARREALKKFGRFAAAAPVTMMLLEPRDASATHKNKHVDSHYG